MAVPDYQSMMLPLLRLLEDGKPHRYQDIRSVLEERLGLSEADLALMLPSGRERLYNNRFGWAKTYLAKAGLLVSPSRAVVQITPAGKKALASGVERIDKAYLAQFPSFAEFIAPSDKEASVNSGERIAVAVVEKAGPSADRQQTPEEVFEESYRQLRGELEEELLEQIKTASPAFFERLVVDLLVRMGYGGSREDAGEAIGRSGDGGIDGIIKEDRLGLDAIYLQAKRWQNTVGRPDIQGFSGSLDGVRAKKGVFITTSQFSQEAKDYVRYIEKKIVLIDGRTLAKLMVDYNVGVNTVTSYEIKRIDSDYFEEG